MTGVYEAQLRWKPVAVLLVLALIWGANMAMIKIGARELAPLFMAGLRSLVASACLFVWMRAKGIAVFPSRVVMLHGMVVGLLFGCEFAFIYVGLQYTLASRTYVLVYTAPFFAAVGAHFFLHGDRLNASKAAGLVLAFAGVVCLFMRDATSFSVSALPGDLMALIGGMLWAATTLYLKKYLSQRILPLQTLFYQVFFSAPLLLLMSVVMEDSIVSGFSSVTAFSLFYQCIIVAFLSYLVWFQLIHTYPVSLLHAFSFFTPVFGVFLSGLLILGELMTPNLAGALVLVSLGMVLVNKRPRAKR
ncbi:MAG: DMT family transporter [Thermodesulfobacteriota bacterium]|nr:DMT family transporter [Thermodesulfobacteriota bacterium]